MGYVEAFEKKVKMGMCRRLLPFDERVQMACAWMVRWDFSTAKILTELFLSKNDLAKMKKQGLIESTISGFALHKDLRQRAIVINFLTLKGRRLGAVTCKIDGGSEKQYLGPRQPNRNQVAHDLIVQAICADQFDQSGRVKQWGCRSARMLQSVGITPTEKFTINFDKYVPDAVFGKRGDYVLLELERTPVLTSKKSDEKTKLARWKFLNKLNAFAKQPAGIWLVYITRFQAQAARRELLSIAQNGYDDFVQLTEIGQPYPNNIWDGDRPVRQMAAIGFNPSAIKIIALEDMGLDKWLPGKDEARSKRSQNQKTL